MPWNEPYSRIVVVGSSNTDLVVRAPTIPKPGETVLGSDFIQAGGGKGANQAVAAARLGAHVTLVARVGRDYFGREAISAYRREGIDTRYLSIDPVAATGVGLIVVDDAGENAIAVASGANAHLDTVDVSQAARAIRTASVLLLQLETPLASSHRAVDIALQHGTRVILNPAPAGPIDAELLPRVDVLTPNEHEAVELAGQLGTETDDLRTAAETLRDLGAKAVVVTRGAHGALIVDDDGVRDAGAQPVAAVDSTGAGDAFNGALAVELADGLALDAAVASAQRVAAVSVTRVGAQPSLPTREEVDAVLG
ncbi:MAG: ribokinase, partial [Gemmatimonadota bacterium]|nr:ribokinase [Gemmatimonadota bacterium]